MSVRTSHCAWQSHSELRCVALYAGKEAHRRLHPSSAADFRLLRMDVQAWFKQASPHLPAAM